MGETIKLPKVEYKGSLTLEEAIFRRRSRREFLDEPLTIEQIGRLCWGGQGQERGARFRTVPSAGATYPLKLFVVTADGLFHYLPAKHALEKILEKDLRSALCEAAWGQGFIEVAPVTLVFAAQFERTTSRYGERGIRYVYMEAGHAAQNVHLQAEALGLGSVAVGAFDDAAVKGVLALPRELEPIYMVVVGRCLEQEENRP